MERKRDDTEDVGLGFTWEIATTMNLFVDIKPNDNTT